VGPVKRRLRWWAPASRWRVVGFVAEADEAPDIITRRGVILAGGTPDDPKWIIFDCPCGSDRVMVSAAQGRRPRWRCHTRFWGGASISPSIDTYHRGKKCHYFIRNGRVGWAVDSAMGPGDE
jgi:hypothetical protein